jgi:hypothetical protein
MGKASNRKKLGPLLANSQKMTIATNEGTIMVSFVFDGVQYSKKHQLTASEIHHMKQLCREHGDLAADQMIWKVAVRGMGLVAENIMAKAALDYIKKYYKGPAVVETLNLEGDSNVTSQDSSGSEISNSTEQIAKEVTPPG